MEKTKGLSLVFIISIGFVLGVCTSAEAAITIPIPDDLAGWSYPADLYQVNVFAVGGVGVLKEDADVGVRDLYLTSDAFTLDAGYRALTFDLGISSGDSSESDTFNAWLKDAGTGAIITPAYSSFSFPWTNHGQSEDILIQETVSMVYYLENNSNVYLDLVLGCDGAAGYSSAGIGSIVFSEASVEPPFVIPAPGALLLGCWGVALAVGLGRSGRKLIV